MFKALVAHASDLMVLLDGQGRITYASPASLRILGRAPDSLEGRSVFDFLHPRDVRRAREAFSIHLGGKRAARPVQYEVLHRDGRWRTAEVLVTNLLHDPSVAGMVVNVRDVTDEVLVRDQLAASEQKFRSLVANLWDIITIHDTNGRYLYCSPAVTAQLGYTPEERIGTDPFVLIHPDDVELARSYWTDKNRGERSSLQYRLRHKDGGWRWLESTVQNLLDDEAISGIVVTTRDVTARRRRAVQQDALAAISSSALRGGPIDSLLGQAVRLVAEALEADRCAIVRDAGDGLVRTLAHSGAGSTGNAPSAEWTAGSMGLIRRALSEQATMVSNGNGTAAQPAAAAAIIAPSVGSPAALTVVSSRPGSHPEGDVSFLEAVSNVLASAITREHIELELRDQALHDSLTGLPNRALLTDRLETAMARLSRHPGRVTVLFVDLDNFKLVNDSLGHPAGDQLVSTVAHRISTVIRSTDTVARFGGDEFVVLCEDTDTAAAGHLAERIRHAVSEPINLGEQSVTITASIGMATTDDRTKTTDELLSMADTAMYAAKESGKDRATSFAFHMQLEATERLCALSGMRRALANDEFRLLYQPIVTVDTRVDRGCEALVRWQHPTEGLLAPVHFIDYAEACGLIIPLGDWVIRTACTQSAGWRRRGHDGLVSINVSGLQLTRSDLVSTVAQALEESGAAPADICLEVTENAVMSDLARANAVMKDLHGLGVRIGMDDFGAGHSSLSQLAELPFDFVKVDRSFIRRFDRDRRAAALLETIATLCRALDLPAVVEGVETAQQMKPLQELGIPYVQGFLFGRPMAAGEYELRAARCCSP